MATPRFGYVTAARGMAQRTEALHPTRVDELVYKYMLEDQWLVIGAGVVRCSRVFRSPFTRRLLAVVELPSGRRLAMPAHELFAGVVANHGLPRVPEVA